jgi:hypothetical protein
MWCENGRHSFIRVYGWWNGCSNMTRPVGLQLSGPGQHTLRLNHNS